MSTATRGILSGVQHPLTLTSLGKQELQDSGAQAFIEKYFTSTYNGFFVGVDTSYEIHEQAVKVMREMSTEPDFLPVLQYVYHKGIEEIVLKSAIMLRDMVCEKKDIPITNDEEE